MAATITIRGRRSSDTSVRRPSGQSESPQPSTGVGRSPGERRGEPPVVNRLAGSHPGEAAARRLRVPIAKPSFGEEELEALRAPIESGWVVQGPRVAEFEERFGDYIGVEHAVATTS